ncbi:MAG TPA: GspH/FimT family pseudopilin [Noviherbaspirillum sp.]|uniref:GspH/FimT family pseudopilin n=1 Tax=Noviherbaspirillum sp. TaxID=1926288 RepID=UPI002D6EC621|nr:GspH/FimT family pseudopilin [Noviherbaspirillum sp.]HYD97327.1 GspH/FimT family pseudopilin [Noviherbaspirillum sp.]
MLNHLRLMPRGGGFSVVELLIVVAIVAILSGLAAPSFSSILTNSRVRTGAEGILSGLQLARAEAIRRNTNVSFRLDSGAAWTVATVSPESVVQTRPAAEAGSNVRVNSANNRTSVTFNPLGAAASYGSSTLTRVTVTPGTSGTGGDSYQIDVFAGGQIRMCNLAVTAAGDPRKC